MTSAYGSFMPNPNDPNRRRKEVVLPADGSWPDALRWGYVLTVVGAIIMLLSGLMMLRGGYPGSPNDDLGFIEAFMRNLRVVAWTNIIGAIVLALFAAQLRRGSRSSRRVVVIAIVLTAFVNMSGLALRVTGWASLVIVILLAFAALLIFRPSSNEFIKRESAPNYE